MAEIDVSNYLNNLLAACPQVRKAGAKQVCYRECEDENITRFVADPQARVCTEYCKQVSYEFSDVARVVNSRIVRMDKVKFGEIDLTGFPERIFIQRKIIRNKSAATRVNTTVSTSFSGTNSWSVTKSNGISTTVGGSIGLSINLGRYGTGNASVNFSRNVTTSTSTTEGESTTQSRNCTESVAIDPSSSVLVEMVAYETTASIPFSTTAVVDGDLEANISNMVTASALLTEAQRTLTIAGVIQITNMSEIMISVMDLKEDFAVDAPEQEWEELEIVGRAAEAALKLFKKQVSISRNEEGAALFSEIGNPPDGDSYEVLFTEQIYRPHPACGFNDAGVPNFGIFKVEHRRWSSHLNGHLIRTWLEDQTDYVGCREF